MAFQQALSGLNTASRAIDSTSNNIANSSTVGFKASSTHFSDVYAASMMGSSTQQGGIGTGVDAVVQQFTQGGISTTNNPLDLAINGSGFFRMSNDGAISYTRNGQFHVDNSGNLVNDDNLMLTGHPANASGIVDVGQLTTLQVTPDKLKLSAVATGQSPSLAGIQMSVSLDSRAAGTKAWPATGAILNAAGTPAVAGEAVTISPSSYDYSTAQTVYDSLGNAHTLSYYFVKDAAPAAGTWSVYGNMDGKMSAATDVPNLDAALPTKLQFTTTGKLDTVTTPDGTVYSAPGTVAATDFWNNIPLALAVPDAAVSGSNPIITSKFDMTGTTQYGASFATNQLTQDGYTSGNLAGLGVDKDGLIKGRYTNGQTFTVGQVVLADFRNPNGLASIGGNQWVETSASGASTVSEPGTAMLGSLRSNSAEDSNVDLTAELVNLITQQRNYQANAQSIKTQDQVMQTLVNLR